MSGGKQGITAALPSVTCEKRCLPFFIPFHQRAVSGWAWQRAERVGMLGFTAGTGQKEGSLFLHDFCRWDAPVFDCLAKSPGRQPRSHLPSFGWQHQGLWTHDKLPWGPCRWGHSHYTYRPESARYVHEKKTFSNYFRGKKKKNNPVKIVSGFIPSLSWLSRKVFSGLWPIFYLIIKGKNIASGNGSASLSKSNILNI